MQITAEVTKIRKCAQCDLTFIFIKFSETLNSFVKIRLVLEFNNYHLNIKFTFALVKNNETNFLDVLIQRFNNSKCCVCVKPTNTNIYINQSSHAPIEWKIEALKNFIKQLNLFILIKFSK